MTARLPKPTRNDKAKRMAALKALAVWRMDSLGLSNPSLAKPVEVVRWLGAVQSQDYAPAKWSMGARTPGIDDLAVEQVLADGEILRTHVLRPTWHFVLREDIRWLLELTGPRILAKSAYYFRKRDSSSRC